MNEWLLLIMVYFLPAGITVGVLWPIWWLIRLANPPLIVCRILFVLLGTLALAPMPVGASIVVLWVPHALWVLMGFDIEYYLHPASGALPAFTITATVVAGSSWLVRRPHPTPRKTGWVPLLVLVSVVALAIGLYLHLFPNMEIPPTVNRTAIEAVYGEKIDSVIDSHTMADPNRRRSEFDRLRAILSSDPAVLEVSIGGSDVRRHEPVFHYVMGEKPRSSTCWEGPQFKGRVGLMRCTWEFDWLAKETLRYHRSFTVDKSVLWLFIHFEYHELLEVVERKRLE